MNDTFFPVDGYKEQPLQCAKPGCLYAAPNNGFGIGSNMNLDQVFAHTSYQNICSVTAWEHAV
eukprot:scaffold656_cov403-Pavlova_lutheri.AAC.27